MQKSTLTALKPGDNVSFTDTSYTKVRKTTAKLVRHGIVDPFLSSGPIDGEKFCVLLLPGTIENLQHNFELNLNGVPYTPPPEVPSLTVPGKELHDIVQKMLADQAAAQNAAFEEKMREALDEQQRKHDEEKQYDDSGSDSDDNGCKGCW